VTDTDRSAGADGLEITPPDGAESVVAPPLRTVGHGPPTGDRGHQRVLELTPSPETRRAWLVELWGYREVLDMLARKDFQTRYKRASLGVIWAVAVPLLQAVIMAFVFSRVIKVSNGHQFAVYVMSGVIAYSYVSTVVQFGATSIVDGAALTDKVWFPRALLVVVPALSNLVGFVVAMLALIAAMPIFGVAIRAQLVLLIPATVLLVLFTVALSLGLGALDVYYRDVKFLVTAGLMVWMYISPILYPQAFLGRVAPLLDFNPLTGVIVMFHMATVGSGGPWVRPVLVSIGATIALFVIGAEAQRRHDRLFVDLL
jgi:lipopolysaccharide transport system permease protein